MMTIIDETILNHFGDHYEGFPLKIKALGEQQWLIVLQAPPICRLRLSAESDLTKKLDQMGLSNEHKVGQADLDEQYVIRAESQEAKDLLQDAPFREALQALEPFLELELTHKEYRLIKDGVSPTPQAIQTVLTALSELVKASLRSEGSME